MNKKTKGYIFIIISILCVVGMAFISFTLKNNARKAKKKEPWTFLEFLNNGETITYKTIFVGVSYGIIIGLVDVLGIWYVFKIFKSIHAQRRFIRRGYSGGLRKCIGCNIWYIC